MNGACQRCGRTVYDEEIEWWADLKNGPWWWWQVNGECSVCYISQYVSAKVEELDDYEC